MSHQTGIRANDALKSFFGKCRDGNIRVFKVSIEEEQLVLSAHRDVAGSWEADYDSMIRPLIDNDHPCYILCRLDSKNASGHDWLLVFWSPDSASVRHKMLYASTKATLKQEFGSGQIKDEIHATVLEDVTMKGWRRHMANTAAPAPLTLAETERAEMRKTERGVGIDERQQTLTGVRFPMTEELVVAIQRLVAGEQDYVQMRIALEEERIHLSHAGRLPIDQLRQTVPNDCARYHLYNFKHTHEGDYQEVIVFIYTMPGYNCPVRERMMYSSCKGPLVEAIETHLGAVIVKKIESDEPDELTKEFVYEQVHPQRCLHRPKFDKPKGPPNRGAKRLTKKQE